MLNSLPLNKFFTSVFIAAFLLVSSGISADRPEDEYGSSREIIGKYLRATQAQQTNHTNPASMQLDIQASVPKLKQNGRLQALKIISRVGRISYRVLGFQGSNTVKSQVIARFLQADQQGQGDNRLAITPANYNFKFKGETKAENGRDVYVFALAPKSKELGLFKGELWLDAQTYLPLLEKGRLVKTPSVFFKKIDFERAFEIESGASLPSHLNSTISMRLIGTVQLDVSYTNYTESSDGVATADSI